MTLNFSDLFAQTGLIGIFRGICPEEAEGIIAAGIEGGLRVVEIPLNSPQPLISIEMLSSRFGQDVIVGAGTVTSIAEVEQVANAGGQLVVTPYARVDVVEKAKALGLIAVPGAFTPTEIAAMHECGADAVKIFPADILPPAGLRGLKAVLPQTLALIPVGGINLGNMQDYISAGAAGFGLGSALYRPGDSASDVLRKAREFVAYMQELSR
ncbi:MAG: 2-dehydro-3-deoxy-6-phosphogalactonate aldolase [Desulfuromonadales bacterium]|nr:2-dehydro-3-deoxy-6-phosphogalactonate aldolase [Desulfuromonadales bacterium]